MADLALSQVANRCTENLTQSEYRRLMIGVQLIRDPGKSTGSSGSLREIVRAYNIFFEILEKQL